ncbi:MAG: BON domain-containing protein [Bryobacteraceae bacterium]|nr:BON domain-containing protein [Bryobacteraceae bacterium]
MMNLPLLTGVALAFILTAQAPDNSKMNQRDRAAGAVTADQQKMNSADRKLAQKIRKSVTADKSLSTYAHNVKIITRDGTVMLRGPVRTEAEKQEIGKKALAIAGMSKVTNELEIAPDKP